MHVDDGDKAGTSASVDRDPSAGAVRGSTAAVRRTQRLRRALERVGLLPAPPEGLAFHAFISYSHAADGPLARALQRGLQRFAKPWNRARALHVFRDEASLAANPNLWKEIERALDASEYYILLASPPAAASYWVRKEADRWMQTKPNDHLFLALTDGSIVWDHAKADFDWDHTTALPPTLRGAFKDQPPLWVDLRWARKAPDLSLSDPRFTDAVVSLAAPIHGQQKDELAGEEVRQNRRTIKIVRAAVLTLVILTLLAVAGGIVALLERNTARHQALVATSRQLAALSESELSSNLDAALLFAVRGYRTNPNAQTRSALLQADLYSPRLVRFLPMGGQVTALAGSRDRSTIVAGLADGRVVRHGLTANGPMPIASLRAAVTSVAVNSDARVIAASTGSRAILWRADGGARSLPCGRGQHPQVVGVSPSGHTVAVACQPWNAGRSSIRVVSGGSGRVTAVHPIGGQPIGDESNFPVAMMLASDAQVVYFDGAGMFQVRRLPDWSLKDRFPGGLGGSGGGLFGYSNDGAFMGFAFPSNNQISVYPTLAPATSLMGQAPIAVPSALTVGSDGREFAIADSGTIYLAPIAKRNVPSASPIQLSGGGSVNADALRFFGDASHLISASADTVALWDLGRYDRLARTETTSLMTPCDACGNPVSTVSPDGRSIAILGSSGDIVVHSLVGAGGRQLGERLGPPIWDGRALVLLSQSRPSGRTAGVRVLQAAGPNEDVAAVALTTGGRTLTEVDDRGDIYMQDSTTGRVERHLGGPRDLAGLDAVTLVHGEAAIDGASGLVAIVDPDVCGTQGCGAGQQGVAEITDVASGRVINRIPGTDAAWVAFAGSRLLVQRADGDLEVWNARGTKLQRVLGGDPSYASGYPVVDPSGKFVARSRTDGTVTLADFNSGTTLATFSAPAPRSLGLHLGLAFSPDGTHFVTVAQTGAATTTKIIEHEIGGPALVRSACTTAGRSLTPTEWRTLVDTAPPSDLSCK